MFDKEIDSIIFDWLKEYSHHSFPGCGPRFTLDFGHLQRLCSHVAARVIAQRSSTVSPLTEAYNLPDYETPEVVKARADYDSAVAEVAKIKADCIVKHALYRDSEYAVADAKEALNEASRRLDELTNMDSEQDADD